jgi:hypothetical protein
MPSLYGTAVAVNAEKAYGSQNFGGRALTFYQVLGAPGLFSTDYLAKNSNYSKFVRTLQSLGQELFYLGAPQLIVPNSSSRDFQNDGLNYFVTDGYDIPVDAFIFAVGSSNRTFITGDSWNQPSANNLGDLQVGIGYGEGDQPSASMVIPIDWFDAINDALGTTSYDIYRCDNTWGIFPAWELQDLYS